MNNSADKVKNLGDYIRIVKPSVWIVIAACALLIGGLIVWGFFGRIYFTIDVDCAYVDGRAQIVFTDAKTIYDSGSSTDNLQVIIDKKFYSLEEFDAEFIDGEFVISSYVADYVMTEDNVIQIPLVYKQASPLSLLFE